MLRIGYADGLAAALDIEPPRPRQALRAVTGTAPATRDGADRPHAFVEATVRSISDMIDTFRNWSRWIAADQGAREWEATGRADKAAILRERRDQQPDPSRRAHRFPRTGRPPVKLCVDIVSLLLD